MILLRMKACHANDQQVIVGESFPGTPFGSGKAGRRIHIRRNTIPDHLTSFNSVEAAHAGRDFSRHGDRENARGEGKPLNPSRPRCDLAFREVVHGVQPSRSDV